MNNALGSYVAVGGFSITPSANQIPQYRSYTLRIGGQGSLSVIGEDGVQVDYDIVYPGEVIPMVVTHVLASTTATNIVGYKMFTDLP